MAVIAVIQQKGGVGKSTITANVAGEFVRKGRMVVRGGGRGYQNGGPPFANLSPRLSLFSDHLRTVLAVKGSLRRARQRRALDGSGPFLTTLLRRGKGSLRTALLVGDHFAAILVPFLAATDILAVKACYRRLKFQGNTGRLRRLLRARLTAAWFREAAQRAGTRNRTRRGAYGCYVAGGHVQSLEDTITIHANAAAAV